MKARLGYVYFTFKDSNCACNTSSRSYEKCKYAAVAMVALGAAGAGVAALVTVIRPLWSLPCQVIPRCSYLATSVIALQDGEKTTTAK